MCIRQVSPSRVHLGILSSEFDKNGFVFNVVLDAVGPVFAAEAGLLEPSERHLVAEYVVVVHPDCSRAKTLPDKLTCYTQHRNPRWSPPCVSTSESTSIDSADAERRLPTHASFRSYCMEQIPRRYVWGELRWVPYIGSLQFSTHKGL